jgi:hypothetical protein
LTRDPRWAPAAMRLPRTAQRAGLLHAYAIGVLEGDCAFSISV